MTVARDAPLALSWPAGEPETLERVDGITAEEFVARYARPGRPVTLTGMLDHWEAARLWSRDFFVERYGDHPVWVRNSLDYEDKRRVPLRQYFTDMEAGGPTAGFYLKDWIFEDELPELRRHFEPPEYFRSVTERLPRRLRPKWRWLFIGPPRTASHLHVDFLNTSAWNAVFSGRKRWIFFRPEDARYLYRGAVDAFEPDLERFPELARARPIVHEQGPGEVIFTPAGWWHAVRNEEITIALSGNFLNSTNLRNYLRPSVMFRYFRYADHPLWLK
jgi:hypothetical protein